MIIKYWKKILRWRVKHFWFSGVVVSRSFMYEKQALLYKKLMYPYLPEGELTWKDHLYARWNQWLFQKMQLSNAKLERMLSLWKRFIDSEPINPMAPRSTGMKKLPMAEKPKGLYSSRVPKNFTENVDKK